MKYALRLAALLVVLLLILVFIKTPSRARVPARREGDSLESLSAAEASEGVATTKTRGGAAATDGTAAPTAAIEEPPAAYFGDVALRGRVTTHDGTPVAGARVYCDVSGLTSHRAVLEAALTVESNEKGEFRFLKLPRRSRYVLMAAKKKLGVSASEMCRLPEVDQGRGVTLVVNGLHFERVRFVDDQAHPVRVRGYLLDFGVFHCVMTSMTPTEQGLRLLRMMDIPAEFREDEAVFFYASSLLDAKPQVRRRWKIRVPGFREVDATLTRWPIEKWPNKAERVVLTPDPAFERVIYRVEFPSLDRPRHWGDSVLKWPRLVVRIEGSDGITAAYPGKEVFILGRSARFTLELLGPGTVIEYELDKRGREVLVRPRWPRFSFVDLHYEIPFRKDEPSPDLLQLCILGYGGPSPIQVAWPGYAQIGPLPFGSYRIGRVWTDTGSVSSPSDTYGPITVDRDFHELHWR